jgi:hypothetical protein
MADLIAALVGLIGAVIELCFQLVFAVLESLGFAVGHLASKPEEGERRFSAGRILVALTPFALIVSLIASLWFYLDGSAKTRLAQERETRQLIESQVDRLMKDVDGNGHLIQAEQLTVEDAWGNPLRVKYEVSLLLEAVTVLSDGPDERQNSVDDLSSSRQIRRPKQEIALDSLDKAKDFIRDRLKKRAADDSR